MGSDAIQKQFRSLSRSVARSTTTQASYSMVTSPLIFAFRHNVRPFGATISMVSPENETLLSGDSDSTIQYFSNSPGVSPDTLSCPACSMQAGNSIIRIEISLMLF